MKLSGELDSLLDAVFDNPSDLFSLYWDIAARLRNDERILVQKKIRRALRRRGAISPESALLSACILSVSGFPAHRVLHFLSIYFTGSLNQSLFDLAAGTIFLGDPPLAPSLVYDMTQYTYLEKRLLARRSIEISDQLRQALSPELLLYLYLLSLRADLSNENIQLIALVMKNCFPAQEVRTRLGVASLEEYGEIARAWKEAEERTIAAEQPRVVSAARGAKKSFNLDKASFFLDKYFSDEALEKMHAEAPPLAIPKRPPRIERPRAVDAAAEEREMDRVNASVEPSFSRARESPVRTTSAATTIAKTPRKPGAAKPPAPQPGFTSRSREAASTTDAGPLPRDMATNPRTAATNPRTAAGKAAIPPRDHGMSSRSGSPLRSRPRGLRRAGLHSEGGVRQWLQGLLQRPAFVLGRVLPLLPFILAVLAFGATLFVLRSLPYQVAASSVAAAPAVSESPSPAASSLPAGTVSGPSAPSSPAATTYIVREGDSLWRIFQATGGSKGNSMGWVDFLSTTRETNSLSDPDRIMPGNVLTLSAANK